MLHNGNIFIIYPVQIMSFNFYLRHVWTSAWWVFSIFPQISFELQSWLEDHSNFRMLNFTASSTTKHLIKLTDTTMKRNKTSKGKQCLSYTKKSTICFITQLKKKNKEREKKKMKNSCGIKWITCIPSRTILCDPIKRKHKTLSSHAYVPCV